MPEHADTHVDLDVIADRAGRAHDWVLADPFGTREPVPDSVRKHFAEDVPDLLAELRALRAKNG